MITPEQIMASVAANGARHGDLRIKPVDSLPSGLTKSANKVLAYGEATNHKHELVGAAQVYTSEKGQTFFEVTGECEVTHEEHKGYALPEGKYEIVNEQEYEPFTEAIKKVQD